MPYYTGQVDGQSELFDAILAGLTNPANGADAWSIIANSSFTGMANTAASSNSEFAINAFDLSANSYWQTASGSPAVGVFIRWEHFVATELIEVRLQAVLNPDWGDRTIRDFDLEYSDDLIEWTSVPVNEPTTNLTWAAGEIKRFVITNPAGAHLHWRIHIIDNNGSSFTAVGGIFAFDASKMYVGEHGREAIVQGPFDSGGNFPTVKITANSSKAEDWFNLALQGGISTQEIGHDIGNGETLLKAELVNSSAYTYFPSLDSVGSNNLTYWLVLNSRRFVCATKAATIYTGAYGGLFLPYGTPTQYPYPMAVGASSHWNKVAIGDLIYDNVRTFVNPGDGSLRVYRPDNTWYEFVNFNGTYQNDRNVWPFNQVGSAGDEAEVFLKGHTSVGTIGAQPAYPVFPCLLHEIDPQYNVLGELEGCYGVSGFNNSPENLIDVGGTDYLVLQDLFRNGVGDFWALKLE